MSIDDPNSGSAQFIPRDLEWLLLSWTLPDSLGEVMGCPARITVSTELR